MGKKVIRLTESDLKKIVTRVISEQSEERKLIMAVQKFLNDKKVLNAGLEPDGKTGPNSLTEKAIMKLQDILKIYPTDGKWGSELEEVLEQKRPDWYKIWKTYRPSWFSF